jgi:DNA-binding response OmpR family regulator
MATAARPLRIVVVSPDTTVLHDLSWMLSAVGYDVVSSKDAGHQAIWRQFCDIDFIVLDGRSIASPTKDTFAHHSDNPIYRIFLYDPSATVDIASWFAAGANDALRAPVSRGELLARIRTGARMLEFESRMRRRSSRSRLPGTYSASGLLRKLRNFQADGSIVLGSTSLTTSIDFLPGLCRERGEAAARSLVAALAGAIQQNVAPDTVVAYINDGTFQIVLSGQNVAAARTVADRIAEAFRSAQTDRQPEARFSLSTAIVPWQVGVTPEELRKQGEETLAVARQSGGDCVLEHGAYAKEIAAWQDELTGGSPFANMTAQDIMEPFPLPLKCNADNSATLAALRRSRVPVWPFVDEEGKLAGVASPEALAEAGTLRGPNSRGTPAMVSAVTVEHHATFPEIYETFSTQGCLEMVVVADRRPIGYLTLNGFFSLIEPIDSATYAVEESTSEDSKALLVGSSLNASEPVSGSDH